MPAADLRETVERAIREYGEPMTLKRAGKDDLALMAKQAGASSQAVINGQTRITRTIRMSNAEISDEAWPGPPRAKDAIVDAAGKTYVILDCDTRKHGDIVLCHILTVTG